MRSSRLARPRIGAVRCGVQVGKVPQRNPTQIKTWSPTLASSVVAILVFERTVAVLDDYK
jgi:hypothetical protein